MVPPRLRGAGIIEIMGPPRFIQRFRRSRMASSSIRRVVTGHSDTQVAKVITDGPATNTRHPREGVSTTLIWSTDETPCDIAVGETVTDAGALVLRTQPPADGS